MFTGVQRQWMESIGNVQLYHYQKAEKSKRPRSPIPPTSFSNLEKVADRTKDNATKSQFKETKSRISEHLYIVEQASVGIRNCRNTILRFHID